MKLNQKINDAASKLMETITKGYQWYHDTPEQPFEYTKGSIWLINPETEKWMLELQKDGRLWYYDKIFDTFSKYLSMEEIDFQSFIQLWVEDVLKRGVVSTSLCSGMIRIQVEDVLKRGVVSTIVGGNRLLIRVEDVLERGVVSAHMLYAHQFHRVEDVLENGKQWN